MNILDKLDPIKREYIEVFIKEGNKIIDVNEAHFRIVYEKPMDFFKHDMAYIFNNNTYLVYYEKCPEKLLKHLKRDIKHQIESIEDIQKILWGFMIYEDIPEEYSNMLQFSNAGINDIYETKRKYIDHTTRDRVKSELYKKTIITSENSCLRPSVKTIFKINFESHLLNKKILENFFGIIPDQAFYPKTNHDKIEYVEFLKNWAEFSG